MKSALLILLFLTSCAYAQKQDSLAIKNGMIHYYTYGKGKPIFILSGGPGVASKQEDDLAIELSKKYQCILIDQRGTGKSWVKPMDETTINLETAVQDIEMLRQHLNFKKIAISGHSWGAMLACAYSQKHPSNINSLLLIGGGELSFEMTPVINDAINYRRTSQDSIDYAYWKNPENAKADSKKAEYELKKLSWKAFTYDRQKLNKVMDQALHGEHSSVMSKLMWKSLKQSKFDFTKQKYNGPALVIFGWQDPVGSMTALQYSKTFPKAQIEGIDQCGHMPTVEQPEVFYAKVLKFLENL